MNNLEAVEVLKNTGSIVSLIIARVKDQELSHVAHDDDFAGLVSSQDETYRKLYLSNSGSFCAVWR